MNTVYYGVKTNDFEEELLVNLLRKQIDLLVIPWNEFKGQTNATILLNAIVLLSSEVDEFWANITFQMQQKKCKYYAFMVPMEFYSTDSTQFQADLIRFNDKLPSDSHISLIIPLTKNLSYWDFWNKVKIPNASVMLYVSEEVDCDLVSRWSTEHVSSIMIPSSKFLQNYTLPVLPSHLQEIINKMISRKPPAVIIASENDPLQYIKYMKWFISKVNLDPASDILIDPLQPLKDNLTSQIYEIFEGDTVKYDQYEKAIFLALKNIDLPSIRVLVVGPGRGPIIERLLKVIQKVDHKFIIDSVEKNSNCFGILRERNRLEWKEKINLINDDVRNLKDKKYNLIISELLGSFGCNEACPEVLQNFTSEDTIMIPRSYQNYLQPIYSPMLSNLSDKQLERPYLAKLNSFYVMSSIKQIWKFVHPMSEKTSRLRSVEFQMSNSGKINALQGYFIATLYSDIQIGIYPQLANGYCHSWYPFLFPISETSVEGNSILKLHIERHCNGKVWYEWSVNNKLYNKDGSYYSIGL